MDKSTAHKNAVAAAWLLHSIYRHCHNHIEGPTFLADHPWLGEKYDALGDAYDDLVEDTKASQITLNLPLIDLEAAQRAMKLGPFNDATTDFKLLVTLEGEFRIALADLIKLGDAETGNLAIGLSQDSKKRASYLIRQRLGGA